MFSLQLQWKEFHVSLDNLEAHLRSQYPSYLGNCAAKELTLYFNEDPADHKEAISAHWESLDGTDYISAQDLKAQAEEFEAAKTAAKAGLIAKTWDQMSATERKLVMNLEVTRADLGLE